MNATQNSRFCSSGSLRRYVLDSLAIGDRVSIQTSNRGLIEGIFAIGSQMGARISVIRSDDPERSMTVNLEPDAGSMHFDLYRLH